MVEHRPGCSIVPGESLLWSRRRPVERIAPPEYGSGSKLRAPFVRKSRGLDMADHRSVSERCYDANDIGGRNAFFLDLTEIFRKNPPREPFAEKRPRLWQLI